ncbi:MAG: helix-turn-helix transcriptional regulator [Clostridiales bacterium]|nr:helix-turn-helix transcriptional regulator [Clostridiales bacterium]
MKTKDFKNYCIYTGILGLQYLVCGSVYISQMYYLYNFFSKDIVSIIAMRWNYFAQAFGMLIFIFLFLKVPKLAGNRISYAMFIAIGSVMTAISLFSDNGILALSFAIAYNIIIGLSSGYTLTMLTAHIPKRKLGVSFASAYAIGSVGTYIISVIGNGNFLQTKYVIIVYMLINIINLLLLYFSKNITYAEQEKPNDNTKSGIRNFQDNIHIYLLILLLLILVNSISSLGNNFQFSVIVEGQANLPFSRAFYAISLLCAGLISLRSRKYLALTTFASLLFPVVTIILAGDASLASALLTIAYLFLGFVAVYRSLTIMDIAAGDNNLLAFACTGLMLSRLVEASSTWFSNIDTTNKLLAAIIFSVLFALLLFVFFIYIQKAYHSASSYEASKEDKLHKFVQKYNLTSREKEVFQLLIKGIPNREIAQLMFISDNTVKFHVKNILQKTDCPNRADLINLYNKQNSSILF